MSKLHDLFPDGPRQSRGVVIDDHHSLDRLRRMFGSRRETALRDDVRTDLPALVATVSAARNDAAPHPVPKANGRRKHRRRRRLDPVNVTAGAMSVLAIAAVVILGGAQIVNANPASAALRGLVAGEAQLENSADAVRGARNALEAQLAEARGDAAAYRALLESTAAVTDAEDEQVEIIDPAARTAALAEADAFVKALTDFVVPAIPADYRRGDIDERSLEDIAAAVDTVQTQLAEWAAAGPPVEQAASQLEPLLKRHEEQRTAFAAAFAPFAATLVEDYPRVPQELRNAVTDAAADVVASKLAMPTALELYRAAVTALVTTEPEVIEVTPPLRPPVPSTPSETPPPDGDGTTDPVPSAPPPTDAPVDPPPDDAPAEPTDSVPSSAP